MLNSLDLMYQSSTPCIDIQDDNVIKLNYMSTSKGNQPKYYNLATKQYIKGQFSYQGCLWKDYMVEHLSYIIGSKLNTNIDIVRQDIVKLSDGTMGCMSKDFAIGKEWVPIAKFDEYKEVAVLHGKSYRVFLGIIDIYTKLGIDLDLVKEYLTCMIILDFLLGNEDRHYNNFGVLRDNITGVYEIPPLFDFGLGLFEHDKRYYNVSLLTAKSSMDGKPFDKDLSKPFDMIINTMGKDYINSLVKDIYIPDRDLFPNELGYQYFISSFEYMRGVLEL